MSLAKNINHLKGKLFGFFLSFFITFSSFGQDNAAVAEGQALFEANCKTCHAVDKVVVGPALRGVDQRRKMDWIINFVHNSQKVIASGDPIAVKLFEEFNRAEMKSFPELSDQQIKNIVEYIKSVPAPGADEGGKKVSVDPTQQAAADSGPSTIILILIIIVLVLVLIMLIVFLVVLKRYLTDREASLDERDKELVNQKYDIVAAVKSKMFITIVSVLFVALGVRACWNNLLYVGVEQGYAPVQPVPFSHKQHVGQYNIDCNYCHTGVTKGKQATIPSLNVCMNCHAHIKSGSRFGQSAIAEVVKAYEENRPIKWVRVHNLPDLAYFNHAQHVKVGGLDCKQCHGPIDTMEVVRQFSPLTMGWCINCHRESAVNGKDNAYYDKLLEVHSGKGPKEMKVAEIGGLECAKCHY
ncbi:MAG: c-type cytochrome [Cytophagaceae bacterium]